MYRYFVDPLRILNLISNTDISEAVGNRVFAYTGKIDDINGDNFAYTSSYDGTYIGEIESICYNKSVIIQSDSPTILKELISEVRIIDIQRVKGEDGEYFIKLIFDIAEEKFNSTMR